MSVEKFDDTNKIDNVQPDVENIDVQATEAAASAKEAELADSVLDADLEEAGFTPEQETESKGEVYEKTKAFLENHRGEINAAVKVGGALAVTYAGAAIAPAAAAVIAAEPAIALVAGAGGAKMLSELKDKAIDSAADAVTGAIVEGVPRAAQFTVDVSEKVVEGVSKVIETVKEKITDFFSHIEGDYDAEYSPDDAEADLYE